MKIFVSLYNVNKAFKEIICKCSLDWLLDRCGRYALALSARSQIKQQEGIHAYLCHFKKKKATAFDLFECSPSLDRKLNQNIPPQVALPKWFVLRCQLRILRPKHFCKKFYNLQTFFIVIALENEQIFLKLKRKTNPKNRTLFCTVFTSTHLHISRNITIQINKDFSYIQMSISRQKPFIIFLKRQNNKD